MIVGVSVERVIRGGTMSTYGDRGVALWARSICDLRKAENGVGGS